MALIALFTFHSMLLSRGMCSNVKQIRATRLTNEIFVGGSGQFGYAIVVTERFLWSKLVF